MDFPTYFISGLILYFSGIGGLLLHRAADDELKAYRIHVHIALSLLFISILVLFSYSAFYESITIFFLMSISAILIAFTTRIWKDIFFVFLSVIFALSYIFSEYFIIISTLIFSFGMMGFALNMQKRSFKRIMIRRLPFIILIIFGYLLTFAL